jgi:aminopeptidase N
LEQLGLTAPAELPHPGGAAYAYAWRTPGGRSFAVVSAPDAASLAALERPLPHLGAQSYALFEGARSVLRGVWSHQAPRIKVQGS